ncbi:regenerating islet-derived protein 4-like [Stegastes partitus]|uniref:Regenerating islet-derived protein 4-like n=1 Tax=Stegastes partitus TaxID=144197 RepID=A0A3B4ZIG5_9TELE|nr:PREDICTED: regenerating islet-derived protein 4-like [Stegastes partitus]
MLAASLLLSAMLALTQAAALPGVMTEDPTEEMIPDGPLSETPQPPTTQPPTTPMIPEYDFFPGGWFPSCPHGWTTYSVHCLLYVPGTMTWTQAKKHCEAEGAGATLASVFDKTFAEDIRDVMQSFGHTHGQVWVGGHNTQKNPSWSWSDFLGVQHFTQFCRGESANHEHHCLQLTVGEKEGGCLDDMRCDAKLPSVCSIILM